MKVLAIDTANQGLGVALVEEGKVVGNYLGMASKNHSVTLMPAIDFVMKANKWSPKDLDRIVVAKGPGSYTGLRIGVTTAKTLAWTLGIDLVGVSSLAAVASNSKGYEGLIVPLFDARRLNVYTGAYKWVKGELETIIEDRHSSLENWLDCLVTQFSDETIRFVGTDAVLFEEMIKEKLPKAEFVSAGGVNEVNASSLALLGQEMEPVDSIEAFVPVYLKKVEAEEKWLEKNEETGSNYVEKITYTS